MNIQTAVRTALDPHTVRASVVDDDGQERDVFMADDNPELLEWLDADPSHQIAGYVAPPLVVDMVSARQFKLQLLAQGILDQVDTWVSQQSRDIQVAYEYSGTFVRTAPMMSEGFQAMGFNDQQIDEFFTAASKL